MKKRLSLSSVAFLVFVFFLSFSQVWAQTEFSADSFKFQLETTSSIKKQADKGLDVQIAKLDLNRLEEVLQQRPAAKALEYLLLRASAVNTRPEVIDKLIASVGTAEIKDCEGYRPIHLAVLYNGNPGILVSLLKAGAEVDSRGPHFKMTALMMAAEKSRFDMARVLVEHKADVNLASTAFGRSALAFTEGKHPRLVELLLQAGADPYHESTSGSTIIFSLPQSTDLNLQTAEVLLASGFDLNRPNARGTTPLTHAVRYLNFNAGRKLVERYLEAGSCLNRLDEDGLDVVTYSRKKDISPITSLVLSHLRAARTEKAPVAVFNDDALISVIRYGSLKNIQRVWEKRELGVNDFINGSGLTAFMWAAHSNSDPAVTEYFMAGGGGLNSWDYMGRTPLMLAALNNGNPEVVSSLLAGGADVEARDEFANTALIWAARNNSNPEVLKSLISAGALIEAADRFGRTPWIWAVKQRQEMPMLQTLVEAGADVSAEDIWGWNAAAYSAYVGREKVDLRARFGIKVSRSEFWQTAAKDLKSLAEWQEAAWAESKSYTDDFSALAGIARKTSRSGFVHKLSPTVLNSRIILFSDENKRPAWKLEVDYVSPKGEPIRLRVDNNFIKNEEQLWLNSQQGPELLRKKLYDCGVDKINLPFVNHIPHSIPAAVAGGNCDPQAIRMLLDEGADVNLVTENMRRTPLHSAAMNSTCPEIIETLVSAGAVVDMPDRNGLTPLMVAVERLHDDEAVNELIVAALLKAGADPNYKSDYGMTPLRIAESLDRRNIRKILRAAGALQ